MIRAVATWAVGLIAVAVAVWLIPASVHIVAWTPAGPVRIAMIAGLTRLAVAIGVAAAVIAAAAVAARGNAVATARLGDAGVALAPLWLWVVPYLPWLPDRAPVLLVFAGPLRWVIAAIALGGAAWIAVGRPARSAKASRLRSHAAQASSGEARRSAFGAKAARYMSASRSNGGPRHGILAAVGVATFAVCAVLGLRSASIVGFFGDEPHYLVITHSLLADHDLDIANNHAQRDYRAFFPGDLRPDYLRRGTHGEIYSIHAPGLPAILVPGYALWGSRGAVLTIAAIAAATAVAIVEAASLVAGAPAAVLTWIAVCFSVPFLPHAWLIYPEMPGALIVAWAVVWMLAPLPGPWGTWIARGMLLAVLPWLHTKFVVLLAVLTLALLLRLRARLTHAVALLVPIALSGAAWLFSFYKMYGVLDPEAPYGSYTDTHVLIENIPRGILGLLFDQKFGLFVYAPIYLAAIAGAWLLLRDRSRRLVAIELLGAAALFVATTTRLYMWWGGASAPARFLVPTLPLLAPAIAVAIERLRAPLVRAAVCTTIAFGLAVAAFGLTTPARLFSAPHGFSSILTAVQNGAPLVESLPTFTEENWRAPLGLLLIWLTAGALSLIAAVVLVRRRRLGSVAAIGVAGCGWIAIAAVAVGWRTIPARERMAVAQQGALAVADAYDPARLRGFDYARRRRLSDAELVALTTVVADRSLAANATPRPLDGPFLLPPGRYEARVWMDTQLADQGEAVVTVGRDVGIAHAPLVQNPTAIAFDLPVAAAVSVGVGNAALARDLRRVDIVAASLVPRSERRHLDVRATGPVEGSRAAYAAYLDARTRPEGPTFWTRGTDTSSVVVVASGASALHLTIRGGPAPSRVDLDAAGQRQTVALGPDEIRVVDVAIPAGESIVPVRVASSHAFRPADVDPASTDTRLLGCQVRLALR